MNHENGHRSCVKVTVTKPLPAGRRGCLYRSRKTSFSEQAQAFRPGSRRVDFSEIYP